MSTQALGSRHHRVQRLRRLVRGSAFRQSEHAFVAEGRKVVAAALDAAAPVETVFVAAEGSADTNVRELADRALRAGARVFELGRGVMERVADTVTPQPVCAIVGSVDVPLDTIVAPGVPTVTSDQLVLVCLDVRDPGNLGALMRSAAASGARALVCAAGTVDPFNPKTVRSSAGAIFHVALIHVEDAATVLGRLEGAGFRLLATTAQGGDDYAMLDWSGRIALVLGNEANGLSNEVLERVSGRVTVPMVAGTESLNVAMTGTVLCFEAARRRREAEAGAPQAAACPGGARLASPAPPALP